MGNIFDFWIIVFWLIIFIIIFNQHNFFRLILIAELLWGIFYILTITLGLESGYLSLITFSFFILVFAALEFVLGIVLILCIKEFVGGLFSPKIFSQSFQNNDNYSLKNFFFNNINF